MFTTKPSLRTSSLLFQPSVSSSQHTCSPSFSSGPERDGDTPSPVFASSMTLCSPSRCHSKSSLAPRPLPRCSSDADETSAMDQKQEEAVEDKKNESESRRVLRSREGRRKERWKITSEKNDLILVVQPCWASASTTNSTGPSAMTRCTFIFYLQYRAIHIRHWFVKIGGNTIFETNVKQKVFKNPNIAWPLCSTSVDHQGFVAYWL